MAFDNFNGDKGRESNSTLVNTNVKTIDEFMKLLESKQKEAEKKVEQFKQDIRLKAIDEEKRKQMKMVEELEDYIVELRNSGLKMTEAQMQSIARQQQKNEDAEKKKSQLKYYNEQSKQYKKQQKQEEKDLDRKLKIAKLRSTTDEDGNEKSRGQKIKDAIKASFLEGRDPEENKKAIEKLTSTLKNLGNVINNAITQYSTYQGGVNARLQGSAKTFQSIESSLSKVSTSPLLKTDKLYENLAELVNEGIVTNVEQRAFLMTMKDNIATTFDANSSALKRLIRIQQQDSTAQRLGMEAYLTSFMNKLVENTEYLSTSFDNVQSALLEASALMSASASSEFEYQVQKWLGAMSGLGLSDSTSTSLAQALGYLGSGNIEGLNSSALQNLLVMSASRTGVSYAELLTGGLDASKTNDLLESLVEFVQEIYYNSKDNNVVMSQFASTFGLTISDIKAIANLDAGTMIDLVNNVKTYEGMYNDLVSQMSDVTGRLSVSTLLDNAFNNLLYSMGTDIAKNPITNALWKVADMITTTTGGINIPHFSVLGTGVDINATVEQLMKLGVVGISSLGEIGNLVNSVSHLGDGAFLLNQMGITSSAKEKNRGDNLRLVRKSGVTVSSSNYVGNDNSNAYYQGAMAGVEEQRQVIQNEANDSDMTRKELNTSLQEKMDDIIDILTETRDYVSDYVNSTSGLN